MEDSRVLAVDPGRKRLGLAISDPTGTIANPLEVIEAQTRKKAAQRITEIARKRNVVKIVVGQALDWNGKLSTEAKLASQLAQAIEEKTNLPVILWNEYGSTQAAQKARIEMGLSRKKRQEDVDHLAATVILQSYLDSQSPDPPTHHES